MYDGGKILVGVVIFLCILASPLVYNTVMGKASFVPDPKISGQEKRCVMSTPYMRSEHMKVLNTWRDEVIRQDKRFYETADGRVYDMSLTKTCMKCHESKAEFCDQCHNYVGVTPYCWDCHTYPKEK